MHIPTHILSGWCAANYLRCDARQRLLAMIAATACDLDGISLIFGQEAYWRYHHTFGHNLFFAVAGSAVLAAFSVRWLFSFVLYLALFHLHLLLDYFAPGRVGTFTIFGRCASPHLPTAMRGRFTRGRICRSSSRCCFGRYGSPAATAARRWSGLHRGWTACS